MSHLKTEKSWNLPVALLMAGLLLGSAAQAATVEETIEKTFSVGSAPELEIVGFNGSIVLEAGKEGTITAKCVKYVRSLTGIGSRKALREIEIRMEQDGDKVRLIADRPSRFAVFKNYGVRFTVEVPPSCLVNAKTSNGAIRAEELDGEARLVTSNGSITVEESRGSLFAKTSNGAIRAEMDGGALNAETSNGSVTVEGSPESVVARTSNGRIRVELDDDAGCEVRVRTSNGSIGVGGRLIGENEFRTSNGSIRLALPEDQDFEIDAKTGNGSVSTDFEFKQVAHQSKRQLRAMHGESPRAKIVCKTSNSSIQIRED